MAVGIYVIYQVLQFPATSSDPDFKGMPLVDCWVSQKWYKTET